MAKFKVGDKVRRLGRGHAGMKIGDIGTIEKLPENARNYIITEFYGGVRGDGSARRAHSARNLELVEPDNNRIYF